MDKRIITAALSFLSSSIIAQLFSFLTQIYLMRKLTIQQYGVYSLSFEALAMCNMIVTGTFRNFYARELKTGTGTEILLPYQLLFGSFWCIVSTLLIGLLFKIPMTIILPMSISMTIASLILPYWVEDLVNGYRKRIIYRDISYAVILFVGIVVSINILTLSVYQMILFVLAWNALVALLFFFRQKTIGQLIDVEKSRGINTSTLPFFGVFLVNTLYNKIGITFLNVFYSITDVALYLAVFKFITPLYFIQTSLISSVIPRFKEHKNFNFDKRFFTLFSLPALVVSILLPLCFPWVVNIFGISKYHQLPHLLLYASPIIFITFIYGSLSNFISINGGQACIIKTNLFGIIIYLILLLAAYYLKVLHHPLEACLGYFVITEAMLCLAYYYWIKKSNPITTLFVYSAFLTIAYELFIMNY